ncbi:MAG: hypothetical protein JNM28_10240 [Armatimonadetes bacterium]|nr:hypothetical protein [Armatimonadota bacterium]MBS1710557.1 hypothetical protein [Armatimonadota bacterium]MBX3108228.1 hypothetical protein [Fimbriimonadaceae bacterium]
MGNPGRRFGADVFRCGPNPAEGHDIPLQGHGQFHNQKAGRQPIPSGQGQTRGNKQTGFGQKTCCDLQGQINIQINFQKVDPSDPGAGSENRKVRLYKEAGYRQARVHNQTQDIG